MELNDAEQVGKDLFDAYVEGRLSLQHFVGLGAALYGEEDPTVVRLRRESEDAAERKERRVNNGR